MIRCTNKERIKRCRETQSYAKNLPIPETLAANFSPSWTASRAPQENSIWFDHCRQWGGVAVASLVCGFFFWANHDASASKVVGRATKEKKRAISLMHTSSIEIEKANFFFWVNILFFFGQADHINLETRSKRQRAKSAHFSLAFGFWPRPPSQGGALCRRHRAGVSLGHSHHSNWCIAATINYSIEWRANWAQRRVRVL